MLVIIAVLTLFYIIVILKLYRGLSQLHHGRSDLTPPASVIVAARNEEKNITDCLQSLVNQNYPAGDSEIIIIDDRSTDGTAQIIQRYLGDHDNVKMIPIKETPPGIAPKKNAIQQGILAAKNDILLFTDADCVPKHNWIRSIVSYFEEDVGLVAGFSPLDRFGKNSLFEKLVCLDSLSLAAVAAGSFGAGFPLTCNARNLAYRKSVYKQVGGFNQIAHLISGDDDLFLHQVRDKTNWRIKYAIGKNSVVSSAAPVDFSQFMNQRIRHASKGKHYSKQMIIGLSAVYLFNALLFLLPVLSFWSVKFLYIFAGAFLLKSLVEILILYKATKLFSYQRYLKYFPIAAIFHVPYITIFGLWGQLGKFQWKGTDYHAQINPESESQKV